MGLALKNVKDSSGVAFAGQFYLFGTGGYGPGGVITDGTNIMPTMDAAARAGYFQLTDGTHTQPTMDAPARAGYVALADGIVFAPSITISASPNYSAGDNVGGTAATLTSAMSASGRSAMLTSVCVKDKNGQAPALTLIFLKAAPSGGTYTDNAALVLSNTDVSNIVGVVSILTTDYYTVGGKSVAILSGLQQIHASASSDLYLLIVADASWDAASTSDLTLELTYQRR